MKGSKLGVIIIGIAVLVAGVLLISSLGNKKTDQVHAGLQPTAAPAISPIPTATISPTKVPAKTSVYSDEVRAKARSEFINKCNTQAHYSIAECTCAADYLAKNYSETELAKIYVQYHATGVVPAALEAAAKACSKQ